MAAAAGARAANEAVKAAANKQLATMLQTTTPLSETVYHKFAAELDLHALAYDWEPWILDYNIPRPAGANLTVKEKADEKNAFLVIKKKTLQHPVGDTLEACPIGNSQEAAKILKEHFHSSSQAGQARAMHAFYSSSMAKTNLNVTAWAAHVRRSAKIVEEVGGQANERAQCVQFVHGLLSPQFNPIKTVLDAGQQRPWAQTVKLVLEYAAANNLETLTKNSHRDRRAKIYTLDDDTGNYNQRKPDVCRQWQRYDCRFGDRCKFEHSGPGANRANNTHRHGGGKKKGGNPNKEHPAADCHYCNSSDHVLRNCPVLKGDLAPQAPTTSQVSDQGSNVHVLDDQRDPDFVFYADDACQSDSESQTVDQDATPNPINAITAIMAALWLMMYTPLRALAGNAARFPGKTTAAVLLALSLLIVLSDGARPASQGGARIRSEAYYASNQTAPTTLRFQNKFEWCCDTGTNRFVTNDLADFIPDSINYTPTVVAVGGGNISSSCTGAVLIKSLTTDALIKCNDVLYMPHCRKKLMPASPFLRQGCSLQLKGRRVSSGSANSEITRRRVTSGSDCDTVSLSASDGKSLFKGKEIGGLYYYKSKTVRAASPAAHTAPEDKGQSYFGLPIGRIGTSAQNFGRRLLETHWAYGHLHFDKLRKLLGLKKGDNPDCPACSMAKSRRGPIRENRPRSTRVNHRMHLDLGFLKMGDAFQVCVDDYTRVSYLDVLDGKGSALTAWRNLKARLENKHSPWTFAIVRSDSEPIYLTAEWKKHCTEEGLEHEHSSRYRHDQNGVAEARVDAIGTSYRAMMLQANAPESVAHHCLRHANVVVNNSPTKANNGLTPREKEAGLRLPINRSLLRGPFGCLVFAHIYKEERRPGKHHPRGIPCVYLGYDDTNNTFLVKEWATGDEYYQADLTFHPTVFPWRADPQQRKTWLREFDDLAPYVIEGTEEDVPNGPRQSERQRGYMYSGDRDLRSIPDKDVPPPDAQANADIHFVHTFGPENPTWKQAMESKFADEWLKAEALEKASIATHDVFELVPRSEAAGHKIWRPRPVLKVKINPPTEEQPSATLDKFKFRLTIAAFTKQLTQGIDYAEKAASTVRWASIKMICALAVLHDWPLRLLDISTFFLHGQFKESEPPVYMEQYERWATVDKPAKDWVCRLKKSLYGHPAAPFCAQRELRATITEGGEFKNTTADDCVYVSTGPLNKYAVCGAHVDDILCTGEEAGQDAIEAKLRRKFNITRVDDPQLVTGIQIHRVREKKWLKLHQAGFIEKLLKKWQMTNCKPTDTPMDPGTARAFMLLEPDTDPDPALVKLYQGLVGDLLWLSVHTRPDLVFTTNLASRALKSPTQKHFDLIANRPLRYLAGTIHYGTVFHHVSKEWKHSGASDSDLAGDLRTGRSTVAEFSKLGDYGCINARSTLERKIATSTGQAETYGLQSQAKQVVWERHMLKDMRHPMTKPTQVQCDNEGVVKQTTKFINHTAAKHYRIAQAYIRQLCAEKVIDVTKVPTTDNPADIFTKALHAPAFKKHRETVMGPQEPPAGADPSP